VLVFDDFSPEGKGTGEFLRFVSKGISKDLNVKCGNVTVPYLSLVIVVNNLTAKQFIEESNRVQSSRKLATVNEPAFLRRFTSFDLNEEKLLALKELFPNTPMREAFVIAFHEKVTESSH